MRLPKPSFLVLLFTLFLGLPELYSSEILRFGNDLFSRSISGDSDLPEGIYIDIYNERGKKINDPQYAFFQFHIDDQVIKSSDKIWQFQNHSKRKLKNEGTEYSINFRITTGPCEGLEVTIIQQFFPESALVREKLLLSARKGKEYHLTKYQGENLFQFPNYRILSNSRKASTSTEIKLASWELKPTTFGTVEKGNHMYYPSIEKISITKKQNTQKGPITISSDGDLSWFTAYEHASQDDTKGMFDEKKKDSKFIVDAMQGTKGVFEFAVNDEDFMFLGINTHRNAGSFDVGVSALRGAYFQNEKIDVHHPYTSVWAATSFYKGDDLKQGKTILRNYILNQICEYPISREIEFYYNTWGLQRNDENKHLRDILTYDRIFEEIDYAAKLGVDIFVLDDGWEQAQGDWTAHKQRFPQGLEPIKKKLDNLGIKMGLWLSPMGIDSTTQRYKDHPDWVIKDSENKPILAQWGHPAFDFVGGFYHLFIEDCKKLIDQGCLFMKWDAINTFYSSLPGLYHGDNSVSEQERRARYEYLLPIYVTRAMKELTDYQPELVIEIDITEARRVMTGLAPLSQGKFFWMNNGASGYNDYSTYRSQSMRTIINEYAELIPREVLTYANYPHNQEGALKYNTINSILAGNGFWGNLQLLKNSELVDVGKMVQSAKALQHKLFGINPIVRGKVGDSPETYVFYDKEKGAGQIIVFSSKPCSEVFQMDLNMDRTMALLNTPYNIAEGVLSIDIKMSTGNDAAFIPILSKGTEHYAIKSTTVGIIDASPTQDGFEYTVGSKGQQVILWNKSWGKPAFNSADSLEYDIRETKNETYYEIIIKNSKGNQVIRLMKS